MSPAVGARAWMMWAIPALLFLIGFFHRPTPGTMAKDLMQAFDASGATIGLLSATYFYAYAGFMIPAGLLLDAYGARAMVAVGGTVMGLGTAAMGLATGEAALFAGRFAVGLGATVTFLGTLKIAARWFPVERFAFIAAVTATVGVVGALAATAPLAELVATAGWRGAFGVIAVITLAGSAACAVLVRDAPDTTRAGVAVSLGAVVRGMGQVLRNPHTWPPFLGFFFLYAAAGNLMLWIVPCLRDVYGMSNTEAAWYAAATSAALIVAAPLTGYLSDQVLRTRRSPYAAVNTALFVVWCVFVGMLGAAPHWLLSAILFAMGLFGGGFVLTWPMVREVNPPHLDGVAVAVGNLGGFLGAALTQGPFGAILDARWAGAMIDGARAYPVDAYRAAFAACTAMVLASSLVSLLLRETRGRNIHHELVRT